MTRCPAKGPTETKPQSEHHDPGEQRDQSNGTGGPPGVTGRGERLRVKEVLAIGQYLEQIADPGNLARAWASVRANAGAYGVDGRTVAAFDADASHRLASLRKRLLSPERYVPPPVRRVEIPKPDGRVPPLGIPTVADRVVQQATRQVIEPFFEAIFLPASFGYRKGKGPQKAVYWVREAIRRGEHWVAEFDISGFFDNLRHQRLLREVAKIIDDKGVLGLIRWLQAGLLTESGVLSTTTGTPQGGVISPLLANLYLHRLDKEVRSAGFRLIRYADDFVILTNSRVEAQAADAFVREVLADIGLEVAEAKTGVKRTTNGFEFLGFTFHGRFLRPRPRALLTFKDEVRKRTRRKTPVSLRRMIEELNPLLRGWGNYFAAGDVISFYEDLDKWIRMRLRSKARRRFKSKGGVDNQRWPIKAFDDLGLVNLERLVRDRKLLPALGRSLGEPDAGTARPVLTPLGAIPGAYPLWGYERLRDSAFVLRLAELVGFLSRNDMHVDLVLRGVAENGGDDRAAQRLLPTGAPTRTEDDLGDLVHSSEIDDLLGDVVAADLVPRRSDVAAALPHLVEFVSRR